MSDLPGTVSPAPPPAAQPVAPPPGLPAYSPDLLPEDLRTDASLANVKDWGDLARQFVNSEKTIGIPADRRIALPADLTNAEAMKPVYDRLGRPEAPDKYAFKTDALPDGVKIDEPLMNGYREIAHKLGLSQGQAVALFEWQIGQSGVAIAAMKAAGEAAHASAITALKTEMGAAYDEKLRVAKDALKHYGGARAEEIAARYGADPDLVRIFAEVGKVLQEHGVIGRGSATGAGATTPTEAQQQINKHYADEEFMKRLSSSDREIRAAADAEIAELFKIAYPETPAAA